MRKIAEIAWDYDEYEVEEHLDEMDPNEAAEFLGIPKDRYSRMTTSERHDYAWDVFRHSPAMIDEFMGLPDPADIIIPDELEGDNEAITDWLSDTYGFCISGWHYEDEMER